MFRRLSGISVLIGTSLIVLSGVPAQAHDVHLEGGVRVRYEGDDRSFANNSEFSHGVTQRTRLSGTVENDDGAELFIQIQDTRMWGDEGSSLTDTQNVDLHQAFIRLTDPNVEGLQWIFGRQELDYGGGRVFSKNDWSNVGNSFDAARVHMEFASGQWLDLGFAKVSDMSATGIDENVAFLYWNIDVEDQDLAIQPLLVYKENSAANQFLTSLGDHASFERGQVSIDQNFVFQTGDIAGHDASAFLFDARVAVDLSGSSSTHGGLGLGYALQTGDDPADGDDSAYDNLYYDDHKYNGYMDLAQGIADGLGGTGLQDVYGEGWLKADNGIWVKGAVHIFTTEVEVTLPSGSGDPNDLGTEFNLAIGKDLESGMSAEVGGGVFSGGAIAEELLGPDDAVWLYAQGTATF